MPEIKESSVKIYESRLRSVFKIHNFEILPELTISTWFNFKTFQNGIKDKSHETVKGYLVSILHFSKKDGSSVDFLKKISDLFDKKMNFIVKNIDKTNKKKKEEKLLDVEELIDEFRRRMQSFKYNPISTHFIFIFYLYPFYNPRFPVLDRKSVV